MRSPSIVSLPTLGEIARRLGEPVHRIEYVIRSRHIRHSGIAGNCRIFDQEAVQLIEQELLRIRVAKQHGRPLAGSPDN
jgi:hypothetical protein